jgi:hypothetical protein
MPDSVQSISTSSTVLQAIGPTVQWASLPKMTCQHIAQMAVFQSTSTRSTTNYDTRLRKRHKCSKATTLWTYLNRLGRLKTRWSSVLRLIRSCCSRWRVILTRTKCWSSKRWLLRRCKGRLGMSMRLGRRLKSWDRLCFLKTISNRSSLVFPRCWSRPNVEYSSGKSLLTVKTRSKTNQATRKQHWCRLKERTFFWCRHREVKCYNQLSMLEVRFCQGLAVADKAHQGQEC